MPLQKQHKRTRIGGRESQFTLDQLIEHGVKIGLEDLSIQSVAKALNVTAAAVYRRVKSRLELEMLVGEAILSHWVIIDDPHHTAAQHLVSFAMQLRFFCLANPGAANYMQQEFPRGEAGIALLIAEVEALGKRGYDIEAGMVLASAIALITVGQVIGQENRARRRLEVEAQNHDPASVSIPHLAEKYAELVTAQALIPLLNDEQYFEMLITAVADGLVSNLPAGVNTVALIQQRLETLKGTH